VTAVAQGSFTASPGAAQGRVVGLGGGAGAASHRWQWKPSTGVAARALCVRLDWSLVWHIISSNPSGPRPSV
jgi:hypothetical protein